MQITAALVALSAVSACGDNFEPTPKVASYDSVSGMTLPAPCPDWSQSGSYNYANEVHSNFGCAVNRNSALQLMYPSDLVEGHGNNHPDTGITTGVIESYRAGKIPLPLVPTQASSTPPSQ
jgi:type IV pilus biogenesis protein CpaD/CtpE